MAAKLVDNKQQELEIALMNEEAKIMSTPVTDDMEPDYLKWLQKKKQIILPRTCDLAPN